MAIKIEKHEVVIDDHNKNCIEKDGKIVVSHIKGGCGLGDCNCSPGHWISIIEPMVEGVVRSTLFRFDSREELARFMGWNRGVA